MPNSKRAPLRLAFVGWGAIASRVAQLLVERHSNVELIGVGTRTGPVGEATLAGNVRWLQKPEALANLEADMDYGDSALNFESLVHCHRNSNVSNWIQLSRRSRRTGSIPLWGPRTRARHRGCQAGSTGMSDPSAIPAPMLASPRCGAKARSGGACRSPAARSKKRCRMHGGAQRSGASRRLRDYGALNLESLVHCHRNHLVCLLSDQHDRAQARKQMNQILHMAHAVL